MDWEKPMWAGFAVAFISLATVGQSVNQGIMRMLGTLLAAVGKFVKTRIRSIYFPLK